MKFIILVKSAEFMSSRKPVGSAIAAEGLAMNRSSDSEKIVS